MDWTREVAAVAVGGAGGATARYLVTQGVQQWLGRGFPWGTLVVNVLGSLALGMLYVLFLERWSAPGTLRAVLMVGFLGAFTTFSTFSVDTVNLLGQGEPLKAALNVIGNVTLCLLVAWLGMATLRHTAIG